MVPHFRDLFGAKCLVLIVQPITIPLKKINVVGVRDRLGMEKVLMELSIIVLIARCGCCGVCLSEQNQTV